MTTTEQKRKEGGFAKTVRVVVHALIIAVVIRTFLFQPFNIPSGSMMATLLIGDYLFVSKYTYVVNLLSNACRYSPPGTRVIISVSEAEAEVSIRVRDWGSGIPAQMLPHIFDLFVQSEQGLERARGGLGIGLTLVRKIVELHGGRVEAKSEGVGKGSEFSVWLKKSENALRIRTRRLPPVAVPGPYSSSRIRTMRERCSRYCSRLTGTTCSVRRTAQLRSTSSSANGQMPP